MEEMNVELMRPMSDNELLDEFDQMDPRKASGNDGLSGVFLERTGVWLAPMCFAIARRC